MHDQNSIRASETDAEKYQRALDLFTESVLKPDHQLRGCACLLYTSPSPRDRQKYRMPSSA